MATTKYEYTITEADGTTVTATRSEAKAKYGFTRHQIKNAQKGMVGMAFGEDGKTVIRVITAKLKCEPEQRYSDPSWLMQIKQP
jgi:hypothetical protein